MMLFSQPSPSLCKLHYSVNGGEWSDGVDLNLLQGLKKAPLNLAVCMPPEMDYEPQLVLSRAGYFTQWEMVPKEPIFIKAREPPTPNEDAEVQQSPEQ